MFVIAGGIILALIFIAALPFILGILGLMIRFILPLGALMILFAVLQAAFSH